uniref:Uncharacterized protein n=1 Tax=Anguilla anguilla TaxID=7936 RepID=A0A0E9TGP4_ANGAN
MDIPILVTKIWLQIYGYIRFLLLVLTGGKLYLKLMYSLHKSKAMVGNSL